jgi:hypothetical protein
MKSFRILVGTLLGLAVGPLTLMGQIDSTLVKRIPADTSNGGGMNMDAIYNRPFLTMGKAPVALGGYMECNWQHLGTDGVSDGHQFQFRRMTLFASSAIGQRLKFLSELEFEDGAKEISVEFAALDIEAHPLLNFRGGMILNPIGAFNQNHDGPKWEFTDRPISATEMLPATWNNAGFGLYGKYFRRNWMFGYEAYLSGGFDNSIISNPLNRTSLAAAKDNPDRFEEIASGLPLVTAKVAARQVRIGEVGLSYMGGVYNKFEDDGLVVDAPRRCDVFAVDFNTQLPKLNTYIVGEWAWVNVEVPEEYVQTYGSRQQGGFVDVVQPVLRRKVLGWNRATLNLACRLEYVDWNVGAFRETGGNISDDLWSVMPGISFRPRSLTVLRLNYRFMRQQDFLGNPPATTAGMSFGVSTYF